MVVATDEVQNAATFVRKVNIDVSGPSGSFSAPAANEVVGTSIAKIALSTNDGAGVGVDRAEIVAPAALAGPMLPGSTAGTFVLTNVSTAGLSGNQKLTGGVPRDINRLAHNALLSTARRHESTVTAARVEAVMR